MDELTELSLVVAYEVLLFLTLLVFFSFWRVFTKAGRPGWAFLIGFYNLWLLSRIAGKPGWWSLLLFLPGLGVVVGVIVLLGLGRSFGRPSWYGLLPIILADGPAQYIGDDRGDPAVVPGPRRGAFLTTALWFSAILWTLAAIEAARDQPVLAVAPVTLLLLLFPIARWKRGAVGGLLVVWIVDVVLLFLPPYGPLPFGPMLIAIVAEASPVVALLLALPIGRRLSQAGAV